MNKIFVLICVLWILFEGQVLAARAPICREDCDDSDFSLDIYCKMDKKACVASTWGQKAVAFSSSLACTLTVGFAGCPSLAVASVTGQGPIEYAYNTIQKATG